MRLALKYHPEPRTEAIAEMEQLQKEVVSQGVRERVEFAGAVSRKRLFTYLSAADVFVLNTHTESFSFQTVEAMAVGTPVIVSRVGSLPEIIDDGVDGVLVPTNDTSGIAGAVRNIISNASYRESLVKHAQEKARQLSVRRTTDEFMKLVLSICA